MFKNGVRIVEDSIRPRDAIVLVRHDCGSWWSMWQSFQVGWEGKGGGARLAGTATKTTSSPMDFTPSRNVGGV